MLHFLNIFCACYLKNIKESLITQICSIEIQKNNKFNTNV